MRVFGLSDIGKTRPENQDCFAVRSLGEGVLAVVCDGMGGAAAGMLASELACERFTAVATAGIEASSGKKIAESLGAAADAANRTVYQRSQEDSTCEGMGTTLVAIYATEESVLVLNIGDSRAYRVSGQRIHRLTHDHSLVQELIDSGRLTRDQAQRHPRKNVITRAVGGGRYVRSDIFESDAEDGDVFLLCTDGLTNALSEERLLEFCRADRDPQAICQALIDAALACGARDNVTAVAIIFEKGAGRDEQ